MDSGPGFDPRPVFPADTVTVFGKKILVALPWQKQVNPVTAFCVTQVMDRRRTAGMLSFGDAFVAHTRNVCGEVFLKSNCEWMLFIDDDMVVPFGDAGWFQQHTGFKFEKKFLAFHAIDRLMAANKTIVGALYFGRHSSAPPVFCEGTELAGYCRKGPHDEVRATKWVGTGCFLVHRSVFEDISKKFPRLVGNWFTSTEASLVDDVTQVQSILSDGSLDGNKAYAALNSLNTALARSQHENNLGMGEDVSFCSRALAAGHTPYVDLGLICGHIGFCVYGPHNTGIK